jgi:hypothetical protein
MPPNATVGLMLKNTPAFAPSSRPLALTLSTVWPPYFASSAYPKMPNLGPMTNSPCGNGA